MRSTCPPSSGLRARYARRSVCSSSGSSLKPNRPSASRSSVVASVFGPSAQQRSTAASAWRWRRPAVASIARTAVSRASASSCPPPIRSASSWASAACRSIGALDLLRRIADACPLAVVVHRLDDLADDRTDRILYANRATRTQLAIDPENIVGRLCEEQFPGLREQGYIARLMRVVRTGQAEDYEDYYHTDDRISAVFAGHIERIAEGTTATWFENVTRRKEVEREA